MARLEPGQSYRIEILTGGNEKATHVAEVRTLSDRGVGMEIKEGLPLP